MIIKIFINLFLKYLNKINIFNLYLFTQIRNQNEYKIPENINRRIIKYGLLKNLIKESKKNRVDILVYQFYNHDEIKYLNKITIFKTIFYNHSCFLYWIYIDFFSYFSTLYNDYRNSKYVVSLIPFENDYLFKKWKINSILMNNFITYEYNKIIPSNLSSKTILMIGRGSDKMKRFELGIKAMKYIIKEISETEMKIISDLNNIDSLLNLVNILKIKNLIKFVGYTTNPEIYFKNASLHIFPTISESFGLALCETKIYGIPNILVGIDYITIIKGGNIIIYDDRPQSIAKEAIKILKNDVYRKKLGIEARKSMIKFKNEKILKKWIELIFSIYKGYNYYIELRNQDKTLSKKDSLYIIKNQVKLLRIRKPSFQNITVNDLENFSFMIKLK